MSVTDAVLTAVILAGAAYLLYRSLRRNPGACHGCASGGCHPRQRAGPGARLPAGRCAPMRDLIALDRAEP